ncbi:hypothetical protein IscW_ISCW013000 [Ixodes scapularis]|uniref:Uncharacterized protein n=1 Tax=Ixodes scapularis TaxID=6945 RepID=B7QBH8_IXOSC|nr:hypothetical protein IscW_ISCW013000 [Ixodes scapularis]|eukprot:XP_002412904.1 hypothetical protein IscW_ISCW013000 [Ixodes scapularis]
MLHCYGNDVFLEVIDAGNRKYRHHSKEGIAADGNTSKIAYKDKINVQESHTNFLVY